MTIKNIVFRVKSSIIWIILSFFYFSSCHNEEKTDKPTYQDVEIIDEIDEDFIDESELTDYDMASNSILLEAVLDGSDEWFYAYLPENSEYSESDIPNMDFDIIKIVPENYGSDNLNQIHSFMVGLAENHFKMYEPFDIGTKTVEVFYNQSKTSKMITYQIIDGLPDGICTVYTPEGNIFIERKYNHGDWVSSTVEPFSVDWEFYQSNSSLQIKDNTRAFSYEGPTEVVSIMPSINKGSENNLYTIMQKESFKNPFLVNNTAFTGILRAYSHPKEYDKNRLYYELNFTDGYLDGDVKIYNDWGELELHEIFVNGELDTTIFEQEYMDGVAKPIIYFYPEKDMVIDVKLDFDGQLTHTYPKYNHGWQVYVKTDGTLYDKNKQEYYALYWEGQANQEFIIDEGFVVEGKNTVPFLEKSLATLGLNRKEANEFIIYWLPQMENNPYNLIHFSTQQYEDMAKLTITPKPETLIRVMMVFQPLNEKIEIPSQDLSVLKVQRKGFTVVEWGGKRINKKTAI